MSASTAESVGTESTGAGFSAEERASMKARAEELRSDARGGRGAKKAAADEAALLAKIEDMAQPDRTLAERVHVTVTSTVPDVAPKLMYGQPAYYRAGKVLCFFRSGQGDSERYSTFGFSAEAALDDDAGIWATSYALTEWTESVEAMITDLLTRATS
ncbi:DUF1801 domain-containing protein [Occultella kanbiaonis]|uniref:DUF1801 domain-containing protein n=1 Tax=Occultella kanbiaonis TaxID=2675754 RepID=UPI0012B83C26|nr:DUF1801 domain-containing protein [Occultella kanbiaonis]